MTIKYQIEFLNYWHSGSGLTGSIKADNVVNKTEDNLPYIPGKTLKGLLRDAAERIHDLDPGIVSQEFINIVFGKRSDDATKENEGKCFFTNAFLSTQLRRRVVDNKLTHSLYATLASTRIEADGQAKDHSLRQLEVTIPVVMYASIEYFPRDEKYQETMELGMKWIKEMGKNRNRGLGKCAFSILKKNG